ncbi:MAG: hypothetical protein FWF86_05500 [Clostridia bacterium]|nr:hypothetical protein [Clostridia bacterium]
MKKDFARLRELGRQVADIARLPVQLEKRRLWAANNDLHPLRPMVYIDQLPWHELNGCGELDLLCEDEFLRSIEQDLLKTLYRWRHFPCDMVVENRVSIPHALHNFNYGMRIEAQTLHTDTANDVISHRYKDLLDTPEKLSAFKDDELWVDRELDARRFELASEVFRDILPVRFTGVQIHCGVWDRIAQMRPLESILLDLIDRPDFTKEIIGRFVEIAMRTVDQCEKEGLLDPSMPYVHCSGAYSNDLPAPEPGRTPTTQNIWGFGMAQAFSSVSPAIHDEFELQPVRPLLERFGLLYYGCCEPLDTKIQIVTRIRNVRKISISSWADLENSAEQLGTKYVLSYKSNPAMIAQGSVDEDAIRKTLTCAAQTAKTHGTPLEIILKDVSTVRYRPESIDRWEKIAMAAVRG